MIDLLPKPVTAWGHQAPFAFEPYYRPGTGIERMRAGSPPILALAALDAALDVWDGADLNDIRCRSIEINEQFIAGIEARCPDSVLSSPRDPHRWGSHGSFRHPHAPAVMQALIAAGVIGDVRAPDILRFGFTSLFLTHDDVVHAIDVSSDIVVHGKWDPDNAGTGGVT